jgi:hypothetical protein
MTKLIKKSEQYAINRYQDKTGNSSIFVGDNCFDVDDIEVAYEDGRQSVLDDIPNLLFKETQEGLIADNGIFKFVFHIYKSASIDEPRYAFATDCETPNQWYDTLEEAMDAANEDYKERIKEVLGL